MSSHGGSTAGPGNLTAQPCLTDMPVVCISAVAPPPPRPCRPNLYLKSHTMAVGSGELSLMQSRRAAPTLLPPSDEPVSDLDSGCVQPSSVGNPLSYPLHLAFFLCVFTLHSGQRNTHHRMPPCPFSFFLSYNRMCHVSGIYLCMRYHRRFAGWPWCTQPLFVPAFCKHSMYV